MNFFGLGGTEIIIIAVIVTLVFGVGRLPEIGGAMGKTIREFKSSMSDDKPAPGAQATAPAAPLPRAPETREGAVRREEV